MRGVKFLVQVISIIAIVELALMMGFWVSPIEFPVLAEAAIDAAVLAGISGPLIWWTAVVPLQRSVAAEFDRAERLNEGLLAEIASRDSRDEMQRALDMADTDDAVFDVVHRALDESYRGSAHEILVVETDEAEFSRIKGRHSGNAPCTVQYPQDCPVIRSGATAVFSSSENLDACPHLRGVADPAASGTCVPVRILGKSMAVVHLAGVAERPPPIKDVETLTVLSGERLGLVRALAAADRLAQTDPLTGLLNRRSVESALASCEDNRYSVLVLDLDDFKQINDQHGHQVGDQALRLFSDVLTRVVRPQDSVGRLGGEEFLCVLRDLDDAGAAAVADRILGALAQVLRDGDTPVFTTSVGIASSSGGEASAEVIARADAALYVAKARGKNRVEIAPVADGGSTTTMRPPLATDQ